MVREPAPLGNIRAATAVVASVNFTYQEMVVRWFKNCHPPIRGRP